MPADDDAMPADDDAMDDGEAAMDDGEAAMDDGEAAMDDDTEMPSTGTGGLADSSGSNSWAFGLAGALALTALLGGVAIRRRVQS